MSFLIVVITPLKGNYKGSTSCSHYKSFKSAGEQYMYCCQISQAVLELLWSKVVTGNPYRSWKCLFSDFLNSPLVPKMT